MKELDENRRELEKLQAPADFEARLRSKLAEVPSRKKRVTPWLLAVSVLCLAFASLNYSALAFYGKTLLGYEELMSKTIQQLYQEGYGQQINKSINLDDGSVLTIEGVMADRNHFEVYYSIAGVGETFFEEINFYDIKGFFTSASPKSGGFDRSVNKGVQTFESVNAFAKKLTFHFNYQDKHYAVEFPYEANKAVPTTIKKQLNETFTYDFGSLKFKALYATKGTTRIEGTLQEKTDRNISYDLSKIILVADGKELTALGSGMQSSTGSSYKFEIDYAALPSNLKNLMIEIRQFNGKEHVKQSIPTQVGTYSLGPVTLEVLSVQVADGKTKIRISSSYDVMFDQVSVETKNGVTPLIGTESYNEGTENKERTLLFNTTDEVQKLYVESIYYDKIYTKMINIPIK